MEYKVDISVSFSSLENSFLSLLLLEKCESSSFIIKKDKTDIIAINCDLGPYSESSFIDKSASKSGL